MRRLLAFAFASLLLSSSAIAGPDLSKIMRVIGYFPAGQACPVAPGRAITANHVPRLPFDKLFQLNPWPLRWDQGEDIEDATLVPLRDYLRDDLMVMEVTPPTDKFYRWFPRAYPDSNSVIAVGFTRASLRRAYEAGYAAAMRSTCGGSAARSRP